MKIRTQKTTATLLLILWAFETSKVHADVPTVGEEGERSFIELVRNTKETKSTLLNQDEVAEAEVRFPPANGEIQKRLVSAFTAVASTLNPDEEVCEPLILSRLQDSLKTEGLSSEPVAVRQALLLLREKNLIDDVTLMPLLASYSAWESLGYRPEDWIRQNSEGRTLQVDCPTDQFLRVIGAVKTGEGPRAKRRAYKKYVQVMADERNEAGEPRHLPIQIKWLKALIETRYDKETPFSLTYAVNQLSGAKDSSSRATSDNSTPSSILSKRKKKSQGLSNRLALYKKYNSFQIMMLSDLFEKFMHRMLFLKPTTIISLEYTDDTPSESYTLSPQEQYRMLVNILHKEIVDLRNSNNFSGKNPTYDEVLVAAVETGAIRSEELAAAMAVEDLWNPKISFWQKAINITKKYGTTAFILIPQPVGFWAAIILTLTETVVSKKFQKAGDADDRGISIF